MEKTPYQKKLLDPRWQKKRLKILERDNFACIMCKDDETTLHVHHNSYNGNPWDIEDNKLSTYCKFCHEICEGLKGVNAVLVAVNRIIGQQGQTFIEAYAKGDGYYVLNFQIVNGQLTHLFNALFEGITRQFETLNNFTNG